MPSQLQVFLLPANFKSDGTASRTKSVFQDESNFFKIAGTLEAETYVSGEAERLPDICKTKKRKLSAVTVSTVYLTFSQKQ